MLIAFFASRARSAARVYSEAIPPPDHPNIASSSATVALKSDGVVAFSQMVDAATGDSEEPELVAVHGSVPLEAREAIFSHSSVTDYARPHACNQ
ncbi:MAG: hypothetical protein EON56_05180 [Alphaproteobacteria bacterium]|nr:MAG: hypothetical protein EON56_05180 [Alphaproteobacteria bacterium]